MNIFSSPHTFEAALVQYWAGAVPLRADPAHDIAHVKRVLKTAMDIAAVEKADHNILIPAVWFHDLVNLPKDHPDRAKASFLSAQEARKILIKMNYPEPCHDSIAHAIEAHSFSAGIEALTLEAKILQDADRLDSLGAIGIARTFSVGGQLGRPLFAAVDPMAEDRIPDDERYTLDHFFIKLLKLSDQMKTETGRKIAAQRAAFIQSFLLQMQTEIL